MQVAKLTAVQAAIINSARANSSKEERKQIKREIFAVAKAKFGIPENLRLKVNTKGVDQKAHLVLHVGGRGSDVGKAFQLGDDSKFNGTLVTKDELFPPPAPASQTGLVGNGSAGSVFGGAAVAKWFRLDAAGVAEALSLDGSDLGVDTVGDGTDLPTPHLMLAGRTDMAIAADGSIYRKQ